jgi:hypothetical protein
MTAPTRAELSLIAARQPTPDERAGMVWFNGLTEGERRTRSTWQSAPWPADAWNVFKRAGLQEPG